MEISRFRPRLASVINANVSTATTVHRQFQNVPTFLKFNGFHHVTCIRKAHCSILIVVGSMFVDCRHMLKRIIEPDPKVRLSLIDIEHHPWITRNGKLPFAPYVPQPTDKNMKNQVSYTLTITHCHPETSVNFLYCPTFCNFFPWFYFSYFAHISSAC